MQIKTFNSFHPEHIRLYEDILDLLKPTCACYPDLEKWYREKFLTGLKKKERLYIVAIDEEKNALAGCALIKKTPEENKLCTLFVHPLYRQKGLGTQLMQQTLDELGQLPFMTVSSKSISQLRPLLKRFGFHWSASKKGLYQANETEFYFNDPKSDAFKDGLIPVLKQRMKQLQK